MSPSTPTSPRLRFGAFELDPAAGQLRKNSTLIKLPPQPLRLLVLLIERAGTVVSRDEIRTTLWTDSTFVDFEHSINFSINQIRAALSDNADKPRYIETLPRRGYRFISPVERLNGNTPIHRNVEPVERLSTIDTATFQFPPIFFDPGVNKSVTNGNGETPSQPLSSPELAPPEQPWTVSSKPRFVGIAFLSALVLLAAWAVYHFPRSRTELTDPASMEVHKLTESGGIGNAAISPDGRFVVYSREVSGRWSLRLHDLSADGDAEILSPDGSTPVALAFSADGAHIYFTRGEKSYSGYHRLFVMPSLGGPTRAVLEDVDSPPSLSPDGRQFDYTRGKPTENTVEVRIANTDGYDDHLLAAIPESSSVIANGATWSPDGQTIAVGINHEGLEFDSALYAISVADAKPRPIFTTDAIMGRPAWLPPGNALLVPLLDRLTGRSQLWIVSYPDGKRRRLTNDLSNYALTVDLARDGKTAVTVEKNIASGIWTFTNGKPAVLDSVLSGTGPMLEAVELSGGSALIRGQTDLWSFDPRTHTRMPFANFAADSLRACGKYVVINALQQGVRRLLRFDSDGRNLTVLDSDDISSLACSPDGQFVFYSVQNSPQKILRVSIQGGAPLEVFRSPNADMLGPVDISHDGRYIAFTQAVGKPASKFQFAVISTAGGPVLRNISASSDLLEFNTPVRWSADDRSIQYTVDHNGVTNVWQQPLAGGPPKQITNFSSGKIFSFNWSLSGKQLLLGHGAVTSDIVLFSHLR